MKFPLDNKFVWPARLLIIIFTAVGIGGMIMDPAGFSRLTPLNLLLNAGVLLLFVQEWKPDAVRYFLFLFVAGIAVEIIGVKTGVIFGEYEYGSSLGIKAGNVPVLIGVNWWILTYTSMGLSERLSENIFLRSLVGAALMTGLDILIEPIAPQLDFWHWADLDAPLRNYIAWFVISFVFHLAGHQMRIMARNPLSAVVFGCQVVFFIALHLVNKFRF